MDYQEFQKLERSYRKAFRSHNRRRKAILKWYFKLYHRLEVRGLEHIPPGPALIMANHTGGYDLDIMAISDFAVPDRDVIPLIIHAWHYTNHWWGRWFVGTGLPVFHGQGMQYDYYDPYLLPDGECFPGLLAIFPEGNIKRFKDRHQLGVFYPGVLRIAVRYRVPLIPAALVGFDIASPIIRRIPHRGRADDSVNLPFTFPKKLIIEFGEPMLLDRHYDASYSKEQEFRISNEEIRPRLLELLQKYQKMECDPWPAPK